MKNCSSLFDFVCTETLWLNSIAPIAAILFTLFIVLIQRACSPAAQGYAPLPATVYDDLSPVEKDELIKHEKVIQHNQTTLLALSIFTFAAIATKLGFAVYYFLAMSSKPDLSDWRFLSIISWISSLSFMLLITTLSLFKITQNPSKIHIYPFFMIDLVLRFVSPRYELSSVIVLIDVILSAILVSTDIYMRYLFAYFEPPPRVAGKDRHPSLEINAGFISRITFSWMSPLINLGNRRALKDDDLWELKDCDITYHALERYEQSKYKTDSVFMRILYAVLPNFLFLMFFGGFETALSLSGPFFMNRIVTWIQNPDDSYFGAWGFVFAMFFCKVLNTIFDGQLAFTARRMSMHIRSILVGEIYEKSLKRVMKAGKVVKEEEIPIVDDTALGKSEKEKKADAKKAKKKKEEKEEKTDDLASVGKIVTLLSVDTEEIRNFANYFYLWVVGTPISVTICFVGLFMMMKWAALAGVGALLLLTPLTTYLSSLTFKYNIKMMNNVDKRVAKTNEALQGIRIIKYFSWERHFIEDIEKVRTQELKDLVIIRIAWMMFAILTYGGGVIVSFTTFAVYTLVQGEILDPATAFTALALLDRLNMDLGEIPDIIGYFLEVRVAFKRIMGFLNEEELEKYGPDYIPLGPNEIGFDSSKFIYHAIKPDDSENPTTLTVEPIINSEEQNAFVLHDLDVSFPIGKLTTICGSTGSGKSSIILALFGELNRLKGTHYLPDPRKHALSLPDPSTNLVPTGVAYVSQTAFMMNSTIRENIIFGRPFNTDRYWAVLDACALTRDLKSFEGGDLTEIGEKGINISGGQKQRISLARAAYSFASVVILDDPLSAVDAPTARHLLYELITGFMKGRTVILVSHAVGLVLPKSDYAVIVKNGTITAKGTPLELAKSDMLQGVISDEVLATGTNWLFEEQGASESMIKRDDVEKEEDVEETLKEHIERKETGKLVDAEEQSTGAVGVDVYWSYLKAAGGGPFFSLLMFTFALKFGSTIAHAVWLTVWTGATKGISKNSTLLSAASNPLSFANGNTAEILQPLADIPVDYDAMYYVKVYALLGLLTLVTSNVKSLVVIYGSIRASTEFHRKLLERVLGAPLRFFETTPVGRILNRFSKDVKKVDSNVMNMFNFFLNCLIQVLQTLVIMSFISPLFAIAVLPLIIIYYFISQTYINAARELQRMEATTRSPVYSQFSETLTGVSTIRGYGHEKRFKRSILTLLDNNNRNFFYLWASLRWLSVRTEFISALIVMISASTMLYSKTDAGWAGFALSYSMEFSWGLIVLIRARAELEMGLNSVERINEYMAVEQEPPAIVEGYRPDENWPSKGVVVVKELKLRYAPELPEVLKGVSFETRRFEKIGVVGRTGAGKSTLSLAFFRIVQFSGGSIVIDGMDINKMGLHDLRSRLTIIPQDPVLFTGTLRSNLDPEGIHDEAEIWQVLKRVQFFDSIQDKEIIEPTSSSSSTTSKTIADDQTNETASIRSSTGGVMTLDSNVTENGGNFSQGQRQLLCLARALLRKSKVIILDEATASVDNATDAKIQHTIRDEFKDSTLLCIAHRLRTVVDYDRILVLDAGLVNQFGTPLELIESDGLFRGMCQESGEFNELYEIAKSK